MIFMRFACIFLRSVIRWFFAETGQTFFLSPFLLPAVECERFRSGGEKEGGYKHRIVTPNSHDSVVLNMVSPWGVLRRTLHDYAIFMYFLARRDLVVFCTSGTDVFSEPLSSPCR